MGLLQPAAPTRGPGHRVRRLEGASELQEHGADAPRGRGPLGAALGRWGARLATLRAALPRVRVRVLNVDIPYSHGPASAYLS